MTRSFTYFLLTEVFRGKSLIRIHSNWMIARHCEGLAGVVIDLAGGENPSYIRHWRISPEKFIRTDTDPSKHPDVICDLDRALPFSDRFADHVLLFNAIYIIKEPEKLFAEIKRILKPGGRFFVVSPFIFYESPEPHDFTRYTSEGLDRFFLNAGFSDIRIEPFGERFSSAVLLITPFVPTRILRALLFLLATALDRCIPKKLRKQHPAPMGYFCVAKKPESF